MKLLSEIGYGIWIGIGICLSSLFGIQLGSARNPISDSNEIIPIEMIIKSGLIRMISLGSMIVLNAIFGIVFKMAIERNGIGGILRIVLGSILIGGGFAWRWESTIDPESKAGIWVVASLVEIEGIGILLYGSERNSE